MVSGISATQSHPHHAACGDKGHPEYHAARVKTEEVRGNPLFVHAHMLKKMHVLRNHELRTCILLYVYI